VRVPRCPLSSSPPPLVSASPPSQSKGIESLLKLCAKTVITNFSFYELLEIFGQDSLPAPLREVLRRYMSKEQQKRYLRSVKAYHFDGKKKRHTNYDEEGRKHGKHKTWHEQGHPWLEENYDHGLLEGEAKWFDSPGSLWTWQRFKGGKRDGECVWYYPHGVKEKVLHYDRGVLHGEAVYYYPNGRIKEEEVYENGDRKKWTKHSKWNLDE